MVTLTQVGLRLFVPECRAVSVLATTRPIWWGEGMRRNRRRMSSHLRTIDMGGNSGIPPTQYSQGEEISPGLANVLLGAKRIKLSSDRRGDLSSSPALGGLSEEGWETALASLVSQVDKAIENPEGGMYWMHKAEKSLIRLHAECATKSGLSRSRANDVLVCQLHALQGWCQVGRQNPDNRLGTERTTRMFWNVLERSSKSSWWRQDNLDPQRASALGSSFLDLLEIYARKQFITEKELDSATKLMLWKDLPTIPVDVQELGLMYGALMQQVEILGHTKVLRQLEKQWQKISDTDIRSFYLEAESVTDENDPIADLMQENQKEHTVNRSLSSFESERMIQDTKALLEDHNETDQERIKTAIAQWENLVFGGTNEGKEVVGVIVDYYARLGDTAKAIKWLGKLDLSNPSNVPKGLNQLVVSLTERNDSTGVFRAEEILRQLESGGGENVLDASTYAAVAESWLRSNEPQARHRVIQLCYRPVKFDGNDGRLVTVLLRGLRRQSEIPAEITTQVFDWYEHNYASLTGESRRNIVEGLLFLLQSHREDWEWWNFFRLEHHRGLLVDARLSELVIALVPSSAEPDQVIEIFDFLEAAKAPLGIGFFFEASKKLSELLKKERLDHLLRLNNAVLDRIKKEEIDPSHPTVDKFFDSMFHLLNQWKRGDVLWRLLKLIERTNLFALSVSCYSATASTLSWKERTAESGSFLHKITWMYNRLQRRFHAGEALAHPDNNFYLAYIRVWTSALISSKDMNEQSTILKKQLSLLEELKKRYIVTGDARYKPLNGIFRTILFALENLPATDEHATMAESILEEMISLDAADRQNCDPFTIVMHIILRGRGGNVMDDIVKVNNLRKECQVLPSDLIHVNILRACARVTCAREGNSAFILAMSTLKDFRRQSKDRVSRHGSQIYALALSATTRNLAMDDPRQFPALERVFEWCCQDGYLTPEIVNQVENDRRVTNNIFRRLYEDHLPFSRTEPEFWSRKIVRGAARLHRRLVEH